MAVVFTDTFTVAANIDLASYPSGSPQYSYRLGTVGNLTVNATTDTVQVASAVSAVAAITAAGMPTGDQQMTASCAGTSYNSGLVTVRTNPDQYYCSYLDFSSGNEAQIIRRDTAASQTILASEDRGLVAGTHTHRLKVTGAGATVTLEAQYGATAVVTFADTSASRILSGAPGIGGYNDTVGQASVDAVSVDNLVTAGVAPRRPVVQGPVGIGASRR
jgi:hypothetical protein